MAQQTQSEWEMLVHGNRSDLVINVSIAMAVIPGVSLALRFWSRAVAQRTGGYSWDDFMALFAWVISVGQSALLMYTAKNLGLGRHLMVVYVENPSLIPRFIKALYAGYYLFVTGVTAIKFSALLFYARVFKPYASDRSWRIPYIIVNIIVGLWFVAAIIMLLIDCRPMRKVWYIYTDGSCVNRYQSYLANGISDAIIDLIVLLLPMPWLWKLNVKRGRKAVVTLAFVFGYAAFFCSVARVVEIFHQGPTFAEDLTFNSVPFLLVGCLSTPIGIFSISLPSIFYLIKHARQHGISALFTTKTPPENRLSGSLDGGWMGRRDTAFSIPKLNRVSTVVKEVAEYEESSGSRSSHAGSSRDSKDMSFVAVTDLERGVINVERTTTVEEEEQDEGAMQFWRRELFGRRQ